MSQSNSHIYPLMENAAGTLHAASGRSLSDIDLTSASDGALSEADLQVGAETLRAQAAIARSAGYRELASNLVRAAELTAVPNEELVLMYEMLRPGRSTHTELVELADRLVRDYAAPETAAFVCEAADAYQARNLLRRP
jgi:propanediol dehydratase small subunit